MCTEPNIQYLLQGLKISYDLQPKNITWPKLSYLIILGLELLL